MAGDFNDVSLTDTTPGFCHHVSIMTRGENILDDLYTDMELTEQSPTPTSDSLHLACSFLLPCAENNETDTKDNHCMAQCCCLCATGLLCLHCLAVQQMIER